MRIDSYDGQYKENSQEMLADVVSHRVEIDLKAVYDVPKLEIHTGKWQL